MPPTVQQPSQAVLDARKRREGSAAKTEVRWEWFLRQVSDKVAMTMRQRVQIATNHLLEKTQKNISIPVVVGKGPDGGRMVLVRSKPGEFPRADYVQLKRTLFSVIEEPQRGTVDGSVGTPLDYGLELELEMDRSFLVRTLTEEKPVITRILTGPIV